MNGRGKQLLFKLILMVFTALMALAVLEIGLRAAQRRRTWPTPEYDRSSTFFYPGGQRTNPWSRDHPDPLRIAVVGDSITVGAGNQFLDSYGMRLEALLNMNDGQRPAMVRIWAQGGRSTFTELSYLEEIVPWRPHLLILGICLNDTEDHRRREELGAWREAALPPPPPPWLAGALRHTLAGTWVYQKLAARKARRGYLDMYRKLYDKEYGGWHLFVKALRKFNEVCRQENITFVPVLFPLMSDVDHYPFDGVHEQIGQVLREERILYLDLLETFRGHAPVRLQAIPNVDAHPNETAHRMAAEAILEFLLANRLIDEGYVPVNSSKAPEQLWKLLSGFVHNAAATDAAEAEKLKEKDAPASE